MKNQQTQKKYSSYIDEYDYKRITAKISELNKIIDWLGKLKKLDLTADKDDINSTIGHLKYKRDTLVRKCNAAQQEMCEEAAVLAKAYKD